jgi:hypothetical protein
MLEVVKVDLSIHLSLFQELHINALPSCLPGFFNDALCQLPSHAASTEM